MTTASYMDRHAFGDYRRADAATRDEMERAALEYAAREQTAPTVYKAAGARAQLERYQNDRATADNLISLISAETIATEQANAYRARHGWSPRKF